MTCACLILSSCIPKALAASPRPMANTTSPGRMLSRPASREDLKLMEQHVQDLIARLSPSVVGVRVDSSSGSGVVISPDGLVLCAAHVCGAPNRTVHFMFPDGRTAQGQTLGTDHDMDAGLMRITDPGPWPAVELGSGAKIGDWVLALGHPGGFEAERPVVVRLGRIIRDSGFLQTDCTLISGDSGGPLFDMRGGVIGIHSRISESTAENFHVPVETYLATWDRLERGEDWGGERPTSRSTIGVRAVDAAQGCRVERVTDEGPARRAGVQVGDVILRIEQEPITDASCLVHCVRQADPGATLTVTIDRQGEVITMMITVETSRGRGDRSRFRPRPGVPE